MNALKQQLMLLVNTYYSIQKQRAALGNRLKLKKCGDEQTIQPDQADAILIDCDSAVYKFLRAEYDSLLERENHIEKKVLPDVLKGFPVYTEWLKHVKGVGVVLSAVIIASFDIEKATTRSKMWAFAGLSPGLVSGKRRVNLNGKKKHKLREDETGIVCERDGYVIVETTNLVRQDKKTAGYVCPYNAFLRAKLIGVLAASFLRAQSPYCKHYYEMYVPKARRDNGASGRYNNAADWRDKSDGHKNNAAKRYMVKIFLSDLYETWRTIEGLEVRNPYGEEYLGKKHNKAS